MSTSCSISLFLSDESKWDAATTKAHSKRLISFFKDKKILTTSLSTIWDNTDGFAEQYRCASELYLTSVMSQPGHGKEVVDGLNAFDNAIYI